MGKTNSHWGQIREIEAIDMPPEKAGKYWPLFKELCLRLEKTNGSNALVIAFATGRQAGSARAAMSRYFADRLGEDAVEMVTGTDFDGTPGLFIKRGPNWGKS